MKDGCILIYLCTSCFGIPLCLKIYVSFFILFLFFDMLSSFHSKSLCVLCLWALVIGFLYKSVLLYYYYLAITNSSFDEKVIDLMGLDYYSRTIYQEFSSKEQWKYSLGRTTYQEYHPKNNLMITMGLKNAKYVDKKLILVISGMGKFV